MDGRQFDRITQGLATSASRRRLLAGLGAVTTGALVARGVEAAPSPRAACMKECNALAKASRRETCAGLKGKDRNACLREVQRERAVCRQGCPKKAE